MTKEYALYILQGVVVVSLTACIIAGHNSVITDALLAVCGSVAGVGIAKIVKK